MILLWTNLIKTLDNNDTGNLIQVDMHFPIELHDKIKIVYFSFRDLNTRARMA